jgi:ribosomal-protein-alanine N-acetyltransferase
VRPGAAPDLGAIAAIQAASPEAAQWEPSSYFQYDLRVAVVDGEPVGFLATRTPVAGESEILNLAVAPERRKQGVARELVGSWLEGVKGDVFLEVRASNETAQKFYKSLGFQVVSVRPEYYSSPIESAIVMKFQSC